MLRRQERLKGLALLRVVEPLGGSEGWSGLEGWSRSEGWSCLERCSRSEGQSCSEGSNRSEGWSRSQGGTVERAEPFRGWNRIEAGKPDLL